MATSDAAGARPLGEVLSEAEVEVDVVGSGLGVGGPP